MISPFSLKPPILEVKNLSKYFYPQSGIFNYNKKPFRALDRINLSVSRGESLGIIGESGSGKTTLAKIICGLEYPDEGEIFFCGNKISSRHPTKHIQMIFQNPYSSLNPRLKIKTQIAEVISSNTQQTDKKIICERTSELLCTVGLNPDETLEKFPHQLSGGQKQRVAIARALAANPLLLIADEAVSSLDVSVQAQILNLLKELRKNLALTLIFISHDALATAYVSDRIIVMKNGKIIEHNTAIDLIKNPASEYTASLISATVISL